jgi:hypothetical protein
VSQLLEKDDFAPLFFLSPLPGNVYIVSD